MPSLFNAATRRDLIATLGTLTPTSQAQWGELTAPLLLSHFIDAFRITFAEQPVTVKRGALAMAPVRWLVLQLPLPKNIKAPPLFHASEPGDFDADLTRVIGYIERFAAGPQQTWGPSPIFGRLSPSQWARLHAKHIQHHCSQFGLA